MFFHYHILIKMKLVEYGVGIEKKLVMIKVGLLISVESIDGRGWMMVFGFSASIS
jgi:hypothetical protein